MEKKNLIIERKKYTGKDGNEYFSYFVKGVVRGKEITVDFIPKDNGGYVVLDIVFDVKPTAELYIHEEEMKDDRTGRITKYSVYEAINIDEDGVVYSSNVKPKRDSDKSLIKMLLTTI